ncbi:exopolysaccharide biosynthesis polyprenyl glycosylphosphotransferase [Nevskia soli]|uniref:exopolysaccharide biosynthesis polyprenyl glycosylphosphotransferase n=1 Tax=Nevskia soli TaxID=418856 RepID=UPI0015D697FA|nr:exopolysaccharide biosynthesis polyprenyl glycosylphosphotransferase [Nevskia soli]
MATTVTQAAPISESVTRPQTSPWMSRALMLATDLVALTLAGFVGSQIWSHVNRGSPPIYRHFWPAIALFILIFGTENLYPGVGVGPVELLRKLVRGVSVVYLMLTTVVFMTKGADYQSRGAFFTSWILSILLLPLARAWVHQMAAKKPWFGVPVVILGSGETAELLIEKLHQAPEMAMKPVACLDDFTDGRSEISGVPLIGDLALAKPLARSLHIRHAILAMPGLPGEQLVVLLEKLSVVFPHVFLVPNLMGVASIPVSPMDVGGVLALELRHNLLFPINRYLKRALDVVAVLVLMPLAIPITLICALCIYLVSRHNPFFLHAREGEGGKPIRILKLRSMYPDADAILERYLEENREAREEWERYCKLRRDPRVLPGVGHFLRRSSLDELPQFWNILIGQMSLVGPRPFPSYHMRQFPSAFRDLRVKVRPGLTGLWQISARSEGDLEVQEVLDTYYIRNWSLWLDIFILSRTARAVFFGQGAY